jgi:hypothetical protein
MSFVPKMEMTLGSKKLRNNEKGKALQRTRCKAFPNLSLTQTSIEAVVFSTLFL